MLTLDDETDAALEVFLGGGTGSRLSAAAAAPAPNLEVVPADADAIGFEEAFPVGGRGDEWGGGFTNNCS